MQELSSLYLSYFGVPPEDIVPITGSASNRSYYRLSSRAGSCVGVRGLDLAENKAFLTIAAHFRSKGIRVPEVYAVSEDMMAYLQQDLGDAVLFDMYARAVKSGEGIEEAEELLCRAVAMLPEIQFKGAEGLDFSVCYPQPAFDMRMVMFDLNYFKYCFLKPSGLEFNEVRLQDEFELLASDLLSEDTHTFLYRDFNARNVMVLDGEPYFIDFQGGRRGPVYYDAASFIWHARASFPDALKERMTDAYLEALADYMPVRRYDFAEAMKRFILFRTLQVLGAYGFRGWVEHKANFMVSIPQAVGMLRNILLEGDTGIMERYPYMADTLLRMVSLPRLKGADIAEGRLTVTVTSFSFRKGIPEDPSGNGGGYVFDCRSIHNPGRYEPYRKLTGMDEPVIRFLEEDGEILTFLEHVYGVTDPHIETYRRRGFSSLTVSFGCTGGQHRSVYCAEHLARHIASRYPDVRVHLVHREQNIDTLINE